VAFAPASAAASTVALPVAGITSQAALTHFAVTSPPRARPPSSLGTPSGKLRTQSSGSPRRVDSAPAISLASPPGARSVSPRAGSAGAGASSGMGGRMGSARDLSPRRVTSMGGDAALALWQDAASPSSLAPAGGRPASPRAASATASTTPAAYQPARSTAAAAAAHLYGEEDPDNLSILVDPVFGAQVAGATSLAVKSETQLLDVLRLGAKNRAVAATGAGPRHSSSHAPDPLIHYPPPPPPHPPTLRLHRCAWAQA
jgi:hypothetical protein